MKPTREQLLAVGFECQKWTDIDECEPDQKKATLNFEDWTLSKSGIKLEYSFCNGKAFEYFVMYVGSEQIALKGIDTVAKALQFWWMIWG